LAIWEVLYEETSGYNLTAGLARFNWDAASMGAANNYLSLATGMSNAIWVVTDNPNLTYSQDYGVPIPEPSTLLLIGSGLLGFVGLRRKLKK
jgi:hypothetical protein